MARKRPAPHWSEIDDDPLYHKHPFDEWHARFDLRVIAANNDGVIAMSARKIAERWGWSKSRTGRFLQSLVEDTYLEMRDRSRDDSWDGYILGKKGVTGRRGTVRGTLHGTPKWFEKFWSEYPNERRVNKKSALSEAAKLNGHGPEVLAGLERWKASWDNPKYIPHPERFLSKEYWRAKPQARQGSIFGRSDSGSMTKKGIKL